MNTQDKTPAGFDAIPNNPYLLLTPGPLSTSKGVRAALLRDWCTWDADYNEGVVQAIRASLLALATKHASEYTAVLMQGSGTFAVESCIGSVIPEDGKLLIVTNGAYGDRIHTITHMLGIDHTTLSYPEDVRPDIEEVETALRQDGETTHTIMVHCETTTGILNPLSEFCAVSKNYGKTVIVDAMSSFGGIPMDVGDLGIDYLISSSNKCIQGVPGFGFVIALRSELEMCDGRARSHAMDLYDQWETMDGSGKWRFTSPTHVVRAFRQALTELDEEGGIAARNKRYSTNQQRLVKGMQELGFEALLDQSLHSPIITSFYYPNEEFDFNEFYQLAKARGFVLYPGKISKADTFRIGTIGDVYPDDIERLLDVIDDISA